MPSPIVVLSGPYGSGKTTTCRQLLVTAHQRGLHCAGLLSLPRFDGTRKVGIDLLDLRSGASRPLAEADQQPAALRTGTYRFDATVLAWGAEVLNAAPPCDLLILDELGPPELEQGQGWANALDVLRAGGFGLAVVVVRPALVEAFRQALPGTLTYLFTLPSPPGLDLPAAIISLLGQANDPY
jgi:nucleoside-triphosphatase THEP1